MAAADDSERARRRHRALADPSRARILAELADDGPLDTRELARRVGLHANTVRVHLGALADAGLVAAETVAPRGRGRPRLAYRATGDAPDEGGRRYRLLAEILTTLVARFGGEATEQLVEIGEAWGQHLVDSPPPLSTLSESEAVERLIALLADVGFEPELEPGKRTGKILMRPCPFLELAKRHQEVVCPIHLGLMRGALAGAGATTQATKLEPFVRPDLCVAHLAGAGARS
ncbi:MAG TPA: helix-turn-helix domain-containing protein [Gaiellaceae bacterium]|nr:helix-turn-helix domain-containing protein [Gaiellaceae bacterium]